VSFKQLLDSWRESAATPRTAQTYTVRLPVDDAAQLAALAEMFPGRAPEQLISELLGQALKEVAAAMPYVPGQRVISTDEQGDPLYEDIGPTPRFMQLTRGHRRALEGNTASSAPSEPSAASEPLASSAPSVAANDPAAAPRTRSRSKSSRSKSSRSKSGRSKSGRSKSGRKAKSRRRR